ncbi:MAG: DUF3352 domain-containing protein [Leptolyngbya sp.]|nr:DUF3352 domain-containing protein [Leptolyngbya sp.]
MKFRTFIIPLAVAAGLVLVLGVGLLGGLALRTPLYLLDRGGQAVPQAVQFIPKQSVWAASVLARPDRLAQLWDYLANPQQRPALRLDRERLERAILAQTALTYERDLLPWLGEEITVALVTADLDQDPTNGRTPGYLAALSCRDLAKAQATLELFWQNRALAGSPLTFEDVGGTRLIYSRPVPPPSTTAGPAVADLMPLATALVANRMLLVANDPMVLRQALSAAQATGDNLKTDWRYKLALKTLSTPRVGLLALNLPQLEGWLHPTAPGDSPIARSVDPPALDWGLISFALQRQGVLAEAAWIASPGHHLTAHQLPLSERDTLAHYLPGSLTLEAVGQTLTELGQQLQPWVQPWGGREGATTFLAQAVDPRWGPGTSRQMVDRVNQTYALGLDLQPLSAASNWILASPAQPSVQPWIETLGQQAQAQGLGLGQLEILGHPTTVWTRLSLGSGRPGALQVQTEVTGLSATVGADQVLTTAPELMEQALAVDQARAAQPPWTALIPVFPQAGESYVHLNWPSLEAYLRQQVPQFRLWEAVAKPALKHLETLTLTSYGQTEQVHHAGLFIQLQNT